MPIPKPHRIINMCVVVPAHPSQNSIDFLVKLCLDVIEVCMGEKDGLETQAVDVHRPAQGTCPGSGVYGDTASRLFADGQVGVLAKARASERLDLHAIRAYRE